jgi:hypothetical protein
MGVGFGLCGGEG